MGPGPVPSLARRVLDRLARTPWVFGLLALVVAAWTQGRQVVGLKRAVESDPVRPLGWEAVHEDLVVSLEQPDEVRYELMVRLVPQPALGCRAVRFMLWPGAHLTRVGLAGGPELKTSRWIAGIEVLPPEGRPWADCVGPDGSLELSFACRIGRSQRVGAIVSQRGIFLAGEAWYPLNPAPEDRFTGRVTVIHPRAVTVACTGWRDGPAQPLPPPTAAGQPSPGAGGGEDLVRSTWSWDVPLSSPVTLVASAEYVRVGFSESGGGVGWLVFPGQEELAAEVDPFADRCLARFGDLFAGGPGPGYVIAFVPAQGAVGQGTLGLVTLEPELWQGGGGAAAPRAHSEPEALTIPRRLQLVAHELAHCWWGNLHTPAFGPGGLLLGEGMAEYWSVRALLECASEADARHAAATAYRCFQDYWTQSGDPGALGRATMAGPGGETGHALKHKAASALHLLEWWVGRDGFDQACRSLLAAAGAGHFTLADLRSRLEAAGGLDLGTFFGSWVDGTGLPRLIRVAAAVSGGPGERRARVSVTQAEPALPFVLPAVVVWDDGSQTAHWLRVEGKAESVSEIPLPARPGEPARLLLDPLRLTLFANPLTEIEALTSVGLR